MLSRQEPIELECRPVLKDVICRFGEKCFHDVHYLCTFTPAGSTTPVCISDDACAFDAIVNNLAITSVQRSVGCARVCGNYDLYVLFRYDNQRLVGQAVRNNVPFCVQVPLTAVNGGCQEIACEGGNSLETEVCAFNTRLEVVEAVAEEDNNGANICQGCGIRIRVVVEKVFRAFEHGTQVVCLPVCPPEACVPVPTTISPLCPPFSRPTECPSFCQDDEFFYPDWCDQCPPPQGTTPPATLPPTTSPPTTEPPTTMPPTTEAPTTEPPTTGPPTTEPPTTEPPTTIPPTTEAPTTEPPTTGPPTTEPPTTQPPTTQPPGVCECLATGCGSGTMPGDAFPISSRGQEFCIGFNACPCCNYEVNITFNTRVDGKTYTLFGRELEAMTCNPASTIAVIEGNGEFGRANERVPVRFRLIVNETNNTFTLEIWDLNANLILGTGDNPVALTGEGILVRACPLGEE